MPRRRDRFITEAALQTLLRFSPEIEGLKALQREAEGRYRSTVRQARGAARMTLAATNRARPELEQIYDRAGLTQARLTDTLVGRDLAGLGGAADSLKAAGAIEAAGMAGRLGEAQAQALGDLSDRRLQATSGAQFAAESARQQLASDLAKAFGRQQSLAREQGAFTALTARQLRGEARDRALRVQLEEMGNETSNRNSRRQARQAERNSQRSAGIDPDTGRPIAGGKLDPKGKKKLATPQQHGSFADAVAAAQAEVRRLRESGHSRAKIAETLLTGRPRAKMKEFNPDLDGTADGDLLVPAVPKTPELVASVALDMEFNGRVSQRNARIIRRRRNMSLKRLGLKPPARGRDRVVAQAGSRASRAISGALPGG